MVGEPRASPFRLHPRRRLDARDRRTKPGETRPRACARRGVPSSRSLVLAIVAAPSFAVRFGVARVVARPLPVLRRAAAARRRRGRARTGPSRAVAIGAGVRDGPLRRERHAACPSRPSRWVRVKNSPAQASSTRSPARPSPETVEHGDVHRAFWCSLVGVRARARESCSGCRAPPRGRRARPLLAVFSLLARLWTEVNRIASSVHRASADGRSPSRPEFVLDWVDSVVPEDAALVPYPVSTGVGHDRRSAGGTSSSGTGAWCARILAEGGNFSYTPYPHGDARRGLGDRAGSRAQPTLRGSS